MHDPAAPENRPLDRRPARGRRRADAAPVSDGPVSDGPVSAAPVSGEAPARRAAHRRARKARRGRRALRWTAVTAALALVAGCGGAYYAYQHFTGNISSVDVQVGPDADRPRAIDGALNILVIGTDSRVGLGRDYGDEGSAGHADTTLLLHVARDRSNATVMSIPRDLMVPIPDCRTGGRRIPGEKRAMFNSSLGEDGRDPGCTWTTVEKLTGIRVDHFMMVNFEAVKTLSTAVGGVEVCAAKDIDDPDSHLRMSRGRHVVQGEEALAFVRTRHAVGFGGDLTRIPLQQQFLSSMIRKIKSSDTLTSPTKLFALADAATRALTVDSGIDDVRRLKDLAVELSRVDTRHITFTTVPVADDPRDKDRLVLRQPSAGQLFALVAADRPLGDAATTATTATGRADGTGSGTSSDGRTATARARSSATAASRASGRPTPLPLLDPAEVEVTVRNGTGVGRQAGRAAADLQAKGFTKAEVGDNARPVSASSIGYPVGHAEEAAALATALGLPAGAIRQNASLGAKDALVVVIGTDYTGPAPGGPGTTGSAGSSGSSAAAVPASPMPSGTPTDIQRVQADDTDLCAK
ncbi:LCP family protein [Kitasatospora paranensis]|uniref:LCP family protein n=1 Tax=Kitasatospora paranensis TaxID=258053 RepID=UPI0031EA5F1D